MVHRVLALVAILVAFGCAGTPPVPAGDPPADFTVAITVMVRENPKTDVDPRTIVRPLRPGRYILEPDGQLRVAIGSGARPTTYPPAMRRLTAAQRLEVWSLVEKAGYLNISQQESTAPEAAPPVITRPTALIYVVGNDIRRGANISLDGGAAEPARALIDKMAELAWVEK